MDGLAVAFQVVTQGLRLPIPEETPTVYTAIMRRCFQLEAATRPEISAILADLDAMRSDGACVSGFVDAMMATLMSQPAPWTSGDYSPLRDRAGRMRLVALLGSARGFRWI